MRFTIKVWKVQLVLKLLDIDPSDQDLSISLSLSWR